MPDFEQWYELPPGERVTWGETWFPAAGTGGVVAASEHGALNLRSTAAGLRFDFMPVRPGTYRIELSGAPGNPPAAEGPAAPGKPFTGTLAGTPAGEITARILNAAGDELLSFRGAVSSESR